jgi:ABC-2 type transport system ATP-binding protein
VIALSDVSLEVRTGSIVGLLGPNGAGKSTLMLATLGLVCPDAGRCELFGEPASSRRAREGVGFLPEEVGYEAGFTVGEVLRVHVRLSGCSRIGDLRRWPAQLGLRLPMKRRIARCSYGTVRRLALACALAGRPRLLLLDEPTSGLDVDSREALLGRLQQFRERGGTVLLSSHVLAELERVCDGLVILERGRRVFDGERDPSRPLSEVYRDACRP